MKPITWLCASLARLRASPVDIRADAGYQLDLVQRGETPSDFKPIPDVGSGVMEIRLPTRKADIDLGKQRYAALLEFRIENMNSTNSTNFIKGSGDVFADLGFSPTEARNLRLRTQMMTALRKFIEKEGLTQADAAKLLNVSQPRVSDLTCGKISRFSLDALVNLLSDAGLQVDFKIKPSPRRVA